MTPDQFWDLIQKHITTDDIGQPELGDLEAKLAALPAEEIQSFDSLFNKYFCESYQTRLWGAAYLINGGCSDDGFDYFRGWLIAQGRKVFEAALVDPDSLAEVVDDEVECEEMLSVAGRAYGAATDGQELASDSYRYPDLEDHWDFDDGPEMRKRYPKLAAKFLSSDD